MRIVFVLMLKVARSMVRDYMPCGDGDPFGTIMQMEEERIRDSRRS